MADSASDKTEKATPERRKKAREKGDFAKAKDAGGIAASLGVLLALVTMGPSAVDKLGRFARRCFSEPFDLVGGDPSGTIIRTVDVLGSFALPTAITAALAGVAVGFLQAGFLPQTNLIVPDLARLDPSGKLKNMFVPGQAFFELLQSLLRVAVVGYVVYWTLSGALPTIIHLSRADIWGAASATAKALAELMIKATGGLALLTAADYAYSKYRWEKQNMMSRQEVKDEMRQMEGDPRVKAQQRAQARRRLKKGLVKQVRTADVILANPTHISVALRYRAKEGAPVLAAKGYDETALRIRELAKEAGIPVIENKPLARAIAARVRVGKAIPVDLYAAVAEVLAFVYRLKQKKVFG
ncbi:MAG TPA: EscU/YscU/HrcU family type III secretion system export apparatus switch protein [Polyangiaceae bacterium]|nr:EscU/YscU/HrcU family type III secretion system export apparatus switch protein [Polyangiaceae bacterium]